MTTSDSDEKHPPKLLDQVRDAIRLKHYSIRTETCYVDWIKRYILFHNKRHPKDMDGAEIKRSELLSRHEQRIKTELSHSSIFK